MKMDRGRDKMTQNIPSNMFCELSFRWLSREGMLSATLHEDIPACRCTASIMELTKTMPYRNMATP